MKKHNYTALTTFRGWSEEKQEWVYGKLIENLDGKCLILKWLSSVSYDLFDDFDYEEVHPDSIGVYTGKDDKDEKPIFCGVAGAKYGGDILYEFNVGIIGHVNYSHDTSIFSGMFWLSDEDEYMNDWTLEECAKPENWHFLEQYNSQWEEHLKAKK